MKFYSILQWERFPTLPVVDRWGTFLGALRYRTLRGIEQEHVRNPDPGFSQSGLYTTLGSLFTGRYRNHDGCGHLH